jgi:1-deoxy-D-xylulose-5-phosphate reductoisomerase
VLNAANEIAVDAFLDRRIRFTDIFRVCEATLDELGRAEAPADTDAVIALDASARRSATLHLSRLGQ